jgi:hypothetical protein
MLYFSNYKSLKLLYRLIIQLKTQVLTQNKKKVLATVILIALALNVATFITAYPRTFKPLDKTYAADFSAYYIGEWRLFNNPTTIYYSGDYIPGDYVITPKPQTFMYTPSFLVFFAPFITLNYQEALTVFNFIQLISIFAIALLLYKLLENKDLIIACIAAVIILLFPIPDINYFGLQYIFQSYYWGYALANAHVIQTALIVGAIYFSYTKKPWLSALVLAVSSFDPRVTLLALPILLWYNRGSLRKFIAGTALFIAAFNLPFFFYNNIGFTFIQKRVSGDTIGAIYAYDWLPLVAVATLTVVEAVTIYSAKRGFRFIKKSKPV